MASAALAPSPQPAPAGTGSTVAKTSVGTTKAPLTYVNADQTSTDRPRKSIRKDNRTTSHGRRQPKTPKHGQSSSTTSPTS
eukprot:8660349-Pyramimonas_sp.AAC.1